MSLLYAILISVSPFFELRLGIPLALATGVNPWLAFLLPTLANMLVIFPIFIFLDYLHEHFLKFAPYHRFFHNFINRKREEIEKAITERGEFLALMLFVALPIPGTGAWMGSVVAWLLGIKRKIAFTAIPLGVLIAGILVSLATLGFIKLF